MPSGPAKKQIGQAVGSAVRTLLAAAQAVEHDEISRYGALRSWAHELGLNEAVRLLDQTLEEEQKTDAALTRIAETAVNQQAEAA